MTIQRELSEARALTDGLFCCIKTDAFLARPIPERHRFIFYLGHLEAFDRNLLAHAVELGSDHAAFDRLFAFGIDPIGGKLPDDRPSDWPARAEVEAYVHATRARVDGALSRAIDPTLGGAMIEHRLMHAETLAYMLHQLPYDAKIERPAAAAPAAEPAEPRPIEIPAGTATLGKKRDDGVFGWCNEHDEHTVEAGGFEIDSHPVTNARFLEFVRAGGYAEKKYWGEEDWAWRARAGVEHPFFWVRKGDHFQLRGMFSLRPFDGEEPVYASHAEASAYARWRGAALPTEAEWHRAAFGAPDGSERRLPWGDGLPTVERGSFAFARFDPVRSNAFPSGASAFGVFDLAGNGWEWTSTPFAPFAGFAPYSFYPGYSADFFDGKHYVLKGASQVTALRFLRRSFRNWFQPHYPYIYAKFRCVAR